MRYHDALRSSRGSRRIDYISEVLGRAVSLEICDAAAAAFPRYGFPIAIDGYDFSVM